MIICQWYNKNKLLLELSKIDQQYYLNNTPIDKTIGVKLKKLNYSNAMEVLKNECTRFCNRNV